MPQIEPSPPGAGSVRRLCCAGTSARLAASLVHPPGPAEGPPLVVLHGISRNADALVDLFRPEAARRGRPLVVPEFTEGDWPVFQRPGRRARPDLALLSLLDEIAVHLPDSGAAVDLFGHSGGAQLAHRFAMLYPDRVGALHLAAAGWYCLPDLSMPYPYGLSDGGGAGAPWLRRKRAALTRFLDRPIHIYVGTDDVLRDDSLRQTPELDHGQGRTRHARAHRYAQALRAAAARAGLPDRVTLTELPGCAHDVEWAIRHAGLDGLVLDAPTV